MNILLAFLSGFFFSAIGVLLPGLINLTAAKICMTEGRTRALNFVFGASIIIIVQAGLAVAFGQLINSNTHLKLVIKELGIVVFLLMAVYYFFVAKIKIVSNKRVKLKSKSSRFFLGMLLSGLNVFPVPYYASVSVTLASLHVFSFQAPFTYLFVGGVFSGSVVVFYCYMKFFAVINKKTNFFLTNINKIIAIIMATVALISLLTFIE